MYDHEGPSRDTQSPGGASRSAISPILLLLLALSVGLTAIAGGCATRSTCNLGYETRISPELGSIYVQMQHLGDSTAEGQSLWSVRVSYRGEKGISVVSMEVDSLVIKYGEPQQVVTDLQSRHFSGDRGWNQACHIAPVLLPMDYQGAVQVEFLLTLISRSDGFLLDRHPVILAGRCKGKANSE